MLQDRVPELHSNICYGYRFGEMMMELMVGGGGGMNASLMVLPCGEMLGDFSSPSYRITTSLPPNTAMG